MKRTVTRNKHLCHLIGLFILAGCAPENNQRYGDRYWDPIDTIDRLDPVTAPPLEVTYRNLETSPSNEPRYQALLSIDFTELASRSRSNTVNASYQRGLASEKLLDDLITSDFSLPIDTHFWYDLENAQDRRLTASIPGNYTLILELDVAAANGYVTTYRFDNYQFTVPGCLDNHTYFADIINPVLADHCVACHASGQTNLTLDANNLDNRRDAFLTLINNGLSSDLPELSVVDWIYDSRHPGSPQSNAIEASSKALFNEYINSLAARDTNNPTNNFTFSEEDFPEQCFDAPDTMIIEEN